MKFKLPHPIQNPVGEMIVFQSLEKDAENGVKGILENFVTPGHGAIIHTHFKQDESLTVISGKIGYQDLGGKAKYGGVGETISFSRGIPHRFWNAGDDILNCKPGDFLGFHR